jgi:aromatic-L-amino-acid decarboxylase
MDPEALRAAIEADIAAGDLPAGLIACTGGTGTGACDDIAAVLAVGKEFNLYSHVDAAWAGAGMICPEFRVLWAGIEGADSIVFNPHKWLGAQFDCSAHFLADPASLVKTLAIQPEYLKTHGHDGLINYSEWSLPLGRRFRALKLWFLLRSYGLEALRQRLRNHVAWAEDLADRVSQHPQFEIVTSPVLSLFTFRLAGRDDAAQISFVNRINDDGRIYITQTQVDGQIAVRFQIGQFDVTQEDVHFAYDVLCELAA